MQGLMHAKRGGRAASPGRERRGAGAGPGGAALAAQKAAVIEELKKRSKHADRIRRQAEEHGPRLREVAAAVAAFRCDDEAALLAFHREVEAALAPLEDEARSAALCLPEGAWPGQKLADVRGAASRALRLRELIARLEACGAPPPSPGRCIGRPPSAEEEVARLAACFDQAKRQLEAADRCRDEELRRFKASGVYFDAHLLTRAKHAAIRPAEAAVRAAVLEGRRARAPGAPAARRKQAGSLLFKALSLAQRAYVLAGGADARLEAAVAELAELLADAQAWL